MYDITDPNNLKYPSHLAQNLTSLSVEGTCIIVQKSLAVKEKDYSYLSG